jgi:uncharacterized protein (TIGR02145 family)
MKNLTTLFIGILIFAGLLFAVVACDNTDDSIEDGQSLDKLKDADGNVYKTIKIGTQTWMAENLKTTMYNDGTKIPNVTNLSEWLKLTTGAFCNNQNLDINGATYGRLYNWHAVNTGKLAPAGWHVATYDDWKTLLNYVKANTGTSGSVAKALAAASNWGASSDAGAIGNDLTKNNITGFSALPGGFMHIETEALEGYYYYIRFEDIGYYGSWWSSGSSTRGVKLAAGTVWLKYDDNNLYLGYDFQEGGNSVRCVKDN